MKKELRRLLASVLIVCTTALGFPGSPQAAMIGTEAAAAASEDRARVVSVLQRQDVRAGLAAHGVDPADVEQRVAAMTDEEVAQLAGRIDELPAGGVIGLIVLVFVILLITDILGLTKVFPFTRTIR